MHLPDGFLDPKLSGGLLGAAACALAYCFRKVVSLVTALVPKRAPAAAGEGATGWPAAFQRVLAPGGDARLRRMGLAAAWIFAAQMFNFPVASGTSGHLLGGVFAGVLLGPEAGALVIAVVLTVQAFVFGDGGLLALGANLVNMAVIGAWGGTWVYTWLRRTLPDAAAVGLAAWLSVVAGALACAVEIGSSGVIGLGAVTAAMLKTHAVIGLAEAALTLLLLRLFPREDRA